MTTTQQAFTVLLPVNEGEQEKAINFLIDCLKLGQVLLKADFECKRFSVSPEDE